MALSTSVRPSPVFLAVVAVAVIGGVLAWNSTRPGDVLSYAGVFVLVIGGWVVSLCLHEFAHAVTAWRFGDHDTAARGYLTLNPLKYTVPGLSIVLPLIFVALGGIGLPGGAVWLNTSGMTRRQRTTVSLAGPFANLVLAVILLTIVAVWAPGSEHASFWFGMSFLAFLQVVAVVLNLIPMPGLDGFGAIEPYLSPGARRSFAQIGPYGVLIVVALLFVPQVNRVFFDAVYSLYELSGVPAGWAQSGGVLTRFWTQWY
ncbi:MULTISPECIES: site-2 protease family protein [unclassified Rhodococcus (in: high G+C Gram-positive bacteria)]|uniref:site-2 protease family protein n=1 Tax=unclassified Rhodococcus (in: high G+C Gram-positive bacteria) TaxID=192944 RepID=UPI001C9B9C7B|nr:MULTISPECIES: site-2 protease family protein [unclassified Rhodococcus (in: high G+C Gram-positive bacteria)]MBY6677821.1 site-2 protease family protein [Rhodococcus sp. BP-332]MDQ1202353.1 Zn-dependent protease [Rhodococcus sp. SORGH_AS_0303]